MCRVAAATARFTQKLDMEQPNDSDGKGPGRPGISIFAVETIVAGCLFAFGAVVVFDSVRLGASWGSDGPQSGYFPFYIGLLICISSIGTLYQVVTTRAQEKREPFVEPQQLRLVLSVLIPAIVYVLGIQLIGIYVASAVYIALFMIVLGHYSWLKAALLAIAVSAIFFMMFEVWFKVPLYKGMWNPLRFLGY